MKMQPLVVEVEGKGQGPPLNNTHQHPEIQVKDQQFG